MTSVLDAPYQLLPDLTEEEYVALRVDITQSGIRVPVDVDENGQILDGHHRAAIAAELGIDYPKRVVASLTEEQKRQHAVSVNVHRRNLSREQRRELVLRLRQDGMTQQAIADAINVPRSTIQGDLEQLDETVKLPEQIVGADGKARPSTYVIEDVVDVEQVLVDTETGEVVAPPKPRKHRNKPRLVQAEVVLTRVLKKTQDAAQDAIALTPEQIARVKPNAATFVDGIRAGVEALERLLDQLTEETS